MMQTGQVTAEEVTEAYLRRAALAQQATGCLAEWFGDEAREEAKELDRKRARKEKLGRLHGLPISVKVGVTARAE